MAINQNHQFEDLDGIKCAIVEKNVSKDRTAFLKGILEFNGYKVVVVPSPPPKAPAPAPAPPAATPPAEGAQAPVTPPAPPSPPPPPPPPETFTVGVTDVMFNPVNAIFGRLLRAPGGHVVTLAFWQQKDSEPHDEVPYFER